MPTTSDHIAQAKKNEIFLDLIRPIREAADWGVTALFYAAVHYGRAFLAGKSNPVTTHQHFQSIFLRVTGDAVAYGYYRALQTESEASRYDCQQYDWADVDALKTANLTPFKAALTKLGLVI
jgi:hypothetical protein